MQYAEQLLRKNLDILCADLLVAERNFKDSIFTISEVNTLRDKISSLKRALGLIIEGSR
jgi:hypothetical protein